MALSVYGSSQAVLFGKGLFMAVLLFALSLLSALMAGARAQNGLLSILMLPVLLPILLPAIVLTAGCFTGDVNGSYLVGMFLYDAIMTIAASLLFDFFWYED